MVWLIPNGAKSIVMTAHSVLLIIEHSSGLGSQQTTMLMATDHCSLSPKLMHKVTAHHVWCGSYSMERRAIIMTTHSMLLMIDDSPGRGSQQMIIVMATDHHSILPDRDRENNDTWYYKYMRLIVCTNSSNIRPPVCY